LLDTLDSVLVLPATVAAIAAGWAALDRVVDRGAMRWQWWDRSDPPPIAGQAVTAGTRRYGPRRPSYPTARSPGSIGTSKRMTKEHPRLDFTRADAVRSLLTRALDEIEGPSAPKKRGGR
jgi:hypothetical protein